MASALMRINTVFRNFFLIRVVARSRNQFPIVVNFRLIRHEIRSYCAKFYFAYWKISLKIQTREIRGIICRETVFECN